MIKTLIADDEKHARERLKELLVSFEIFDITAEAATGNEALEKIIMHKPDVAFLDINMPGISVFSTLPSLSHPPIIIFQTAYSEYAVEAYNINALDYIMNSTFGIKVYNNQIVLWQADTFPSCFDYCIEEGSSCFFTEITDLSQLVSGQHQCSMKRFDK